MDKQKFPIQVEVMTFSRKIAKQIVIDFEYFFHSNVKDEMLGWIGRQAIETDSREFVLARHENGDLFLIAVGHTQVETYLSIKLNQIFLI